MTVYTLRFPPDAKIATIQGKWHRDDENWIVATYTEEEIKIAMGLLEESENIRLSKQTGGDVVWRAMERFGARLSMEGF